MSCDAAYVVDAGREGGEGGELYLWKYQSAISYCIFRTVHIREKINEGSGRVWDSQDLYRQPICSIV